MSIHTITCDEFMLLTAAHHHLAVKLYSAEIAKQIAYLAANPQAANHSQVSDELLEYMQLRKVHQVRLEELEGEEAPASAAAAEPTGSLALATYLQNESAAVLS